MYILKKWLWKAIIDQSMSGNRLLGIFLLLSLMLLFTLPVLPWDILAHFQQKKLPVISEDDFYNTLKEKYNIPKHFALLMREKVAYILGFPVDKLSPLYTFGFIGKNSGFGFHFQMCDYGHELQEEARNRNVPLPSEVNLDTIADLIYWFWFIQSEAISNNNH